jgi:hypothetical protein
LAAAGSRLAAKNLIAEKNDLKKTEHQNQAIRCSVFLIKYRYEGLFS